ncbi:MAG: ribosome assembly cofactor RimP [Chitinophagales bacterium]
MIDFQNIKEQLQSLVNEKLQSEPEYFLVDIKVSPGKKIEVYIDGDDGIKIEKCAEISRYLEAYLDTEQPLGEKYVLEVSSPGMSNPLKVLRQYKRRIGREVEVTLKSGKKLEGFLRDADDQKIILEEILKDKKEKEIDRKMHEILFDDFKSTKLKLNF